MTGVSTHLQTGRCVPVGGFQEAAQWWLPVGALTEAEAELGVTEATWENSIVMVELPWEILYTATLYNCCTASPHVLANSEAALIKRTRHNGFTDIFSHVSFILIIIRGFYVHNVRVSNFLPIFGQTAQGNRKYPMSHWLVFNLHMTSTHPPADKLEECVGELTKSSAKTAWHQVTCCIQDHSALHQQLNHNSESQTCSHNSVFSYPFQSVWDTFVLFLSPIALC